MGTDLQFLIILLLSPLLQGTIRRMKALAQGRKGPAVLQPYRDLARLFKKDMVISETASWVFHASPFIVFLSTLAASMMIPVITDGASVQSMGDIIALIYTLALGRFFLTLAGLDAGTAFGGEGSSREATIAILVEPMMMLSIFTAALNGGSTSIAAVVRSGHIPGPSQVLAFAAFFVALIAETGRIPVDNPDTHLELTMIHEGMLLEYSGPYLALMEWAQMMKQMLLFTVAMDLFFPLGITILPFAAGGVARSALFYALKMLAMAAAVALAESSMAKLRFFQLPSLLGGAFVLALLSIITLVMIGG